MPLFWLECSCGQRMKVPEKALGSSRRCFRCGEWVNVSANNTTPVSEEPVPSNEGTPAPAQSIFSPPPPATAPEPSPSATTAGRDRHGRKDASKLRIGELLVQQGIVSQHQLERALARQKDKGGKVVENLIALDFLDTRTFLNFLSKQPGTASIDLLNYTIPSEVIDLVPADFALKHELLPIDKMGRQLTVGMACPLDSETVNELVEMTGMKIRPLLVSMNDIRVALERYYRPRRAETFNLPPSVTPALRPSPTPQETLPKVESALTFETVVHLVREVTSLPALPETVREVRAAMENPASSATDVAEIIRKDPSISAKVLGLANSPAYGFSHHVDSVELATSLLGLREIYSVVLSSAVIDYFERSSTFDYKGFWRRSMICATAAKILAKEGGRKDLSGIFAAGLMHDLGRAVLAEVVPQRYKELDQHMPDEELIAKENELFGVAHPEVGYILAKGWKLPVAICEAIRFHHDFRQAQQGRDIVTLVALAAFMTDTYGKIRRDNVRAFAEQCKEMLQELQMSDQAFIKVLADTSAAIKTELAEPTVAQTKGD
ncbi:MAG: HDOD domain-containing protein [Candidatus Hydrogenedentes bacterium]|nr:HDOD domain-containing protein [Candidatus Hydrogenedentota bacterium]